jgi:fermentation-respiration switch protein FrsA (DUF1100 family)
MKMAGAKRPLLVAVLAIVGLQVSPLLFEKKLIYFPYRELDLTPADLRLSFEDVTLRAEDGLRLHGWFLPVPDASHAVLLCHGNAGNISHRLDRALLLQSKLKLSVFLFDYRGYGKSEGSPDEEGTYLDGRAAYQYLTDRGIAPDGIVLFGESLGAAIAVQLALEKPAAALVLESPFTSIRDMATAAYPFLPLGRLVRTRYDNLAKISSIKTPLLILHGKRDRIVPFEQGERLFRAAPEPKRFFAIADADHNDTFLSGDEGYWVAWEELLGSL